LFERFSGLPHLSFQKSGYVIVKRYCASHIMMLSNQAS